MQIIVVLEIAHSHCNLTNPCKLKWKKITLKQPCSLSIYLSTRQEYKVKRNSEKREASAELLITTNGPTTYEMLILKINQKWQYLSRLQHLILSFLIFLRTKPWLLAKPRRVLPASLKRAGPNLKSLIWERVGFAERPREQVPINASHYGIKNGIKIPACLCLFVSVHACMKERSVLQNVIYFQCKKLAFWTARGTGSATS